MGPPAIFDHFPRGSLVLVGHAHGCGIALTAVQNLIQATVALVNERFNLLTGQLTVNFRFARDPAVMAQIRGQKNDSTVTMKACPN
jgi:hypothetical protein